MARLETQINQIYLTHPDAKTASLILYEEAISNSAQLFIVAELRDLQKKVEAQSLKKISEIILMSFRGNKKLAAEALFETSLAQINQNLADLAHEGNKSWVGKFSCLIALKSGDNIFLANNGQTCAKLIRKSELLEILPAEKRGVHPLKSFQNFSQGKLLSGDVFVLTTTNVFNYVSLELFGKIMDQGSEQASMEISKILQGSMSDKEAFCSFFISVLKKPSEAGVKPETNDVLESAAIYAPLPEETNSIGKLTVPFTSAFSKLKLPGLPKVSGVFSRFRLPKLEWSFFKRLTPAGKFFFISFSIFLILFIINISIYGFKLRGQRVAEKIDQQAQTVGNDIAAVKSALIYKDATQVQEIFTQAVTDYNLLKSMDETRTAEFEVEFQKLYNQVNKASVAQDPAVFAEFTHHPLYLAKNLAGFLLAGVDSNSVSTLTGTKLQDYFLLNSINQNITSVAYWQPVGTTLAVSDKIYRIDDTLKQYEPFVTFPGGSINRIKTYNNLLYALDGKNGKLYRISQSKGKYVTQVAATGDFTDVRDFAIDKDIYLLGADKITRISGGQAFAFTLPFMTDPISNGTRIFIASNIYVLEANKKRVVIMSKTGALINQISFPSTNALLDLYVDEGSRSLYLLDDNKLYKITF